jgi:hypothetical protein
MAIRTGEQTEGLAAVQEKVRVAVLFVEMVQEKSAALAAHLGEAPERYAAEAMFRAMDQAREALREAERTAVLFWAWYSVLYPDTGRRAP